MNDVVCTGCGCVQSTRSHEIWNDGELCSLNVRKVCVVDQVLLLVVTAYDDADLVVLTEQELQVATADEPSGAGYDNEFFTHRDARGF